LIFPAEKGDLDLLAFVFVRVVLHWPQGSRFGSTKRVAPAVFALKIMGWPIRARPERAPTKSSLFRVRSGSRASPTRSAEHEQPNQARDAVAQSFALAETSRVVTRLEHAHRRTHSILGLTESVFKRLKTAPCVDLSQRSAERR
jgi:hypothetical protein